MGQRRQRPPHPTRIPRPGPVTVRNVLDDLHPAARAAVVAECAARGVPVTAVHVVDPTRAEFVVR